MKHRIALMLALTGAFCAGNLNGQTTRQPKPKEIMPAVQVYFDLNKWAIKKAETEKLDKLISDLITKKDYKVVLTGHTDSLGSDDYNLVLSQKRVDGVYDYLRGKGMDSLVLEKSYFGESKPREINEDEEKRQKNRRVEITIIYKEKKVAPPPPKPVVKDTCNYDTTVSLGGGIKVRMNICAYRQLCKESATCIKVKATQGASDIMNSDYPLKNAKGQNMTYVGIFNISMCGDTCLKKRPMTVIFDVDIECYKRGKMSVWEDKGKGYWEQNKNNRPGFSKDKTSARFEFPVRCPGNIALCNAQTGKYRAKFKPSGVNISELYVASDCPTMIIPGIKVGSRWEIVYDKLNIKDAKLYAKTDDGNTFQINGADLNGIKRSKTKVGRIHKKYKVSKKLLGAGE
jgi:hypothetical protein